MVELEKSKDITGTQKEAFEAETRLIQISMKDEAIEGAAEEVVKEQKIQTPSLILTHPRSWSLSYLKMMRTDAVQVHLWAQDMAHCQPAHCAELIVGQPIGPTVKGQPMDD